MYRYELTDGQGEQIASFFPDRYHQGRAGRPWKDHRLLVKGTVTLPFGSGCSVPTSPLSFPPVRISPARKPLIGPPTDSGT